MHSETELKALADKALSLVDGFDAEVLLSSGDNALTRFSENVITQNVAGSDISISIRLLKDNRMGKSSTGNITDDGIKRCIEIAKATLDIAEQDNEIMPLVEPQEYQKNPTSYFEASHNLTPEARADGVIKAVEACKKNNLQAAGIHSNSGSSVAIANSKGLWAYNKSSHATISLSAMSDDSSGWAEDTDSDITKLNIDHVISKAVQGAIDGKKPGEIEPGAYTVVFEPAAVADFLLFLGWEGLNGLSFVEGRSCFSDRVGDRIVGKNITLRDDFTHPLTPGTPFDFEGCAKSPVTLIEKGVFKTTVHDRRTALKAGVESTGHSMPQPDTYGPMPLNIVMSPGDSSLEEMIASTENGLLVTRLHYSNILNPMIMMLTGMTRDGLFAIENGKVTKGLKNMRYTESVLHLLSNVEALSSKLYETETFWGGGGTIVPAIKVNDFHFTSKTEN
ncbi:MAG: TldD/PmbA family protein [Calditrichaeota bacterium]|nr:TldD/PmbA family protein [Calditrichota bacterium]